MKKYDAIVIGGGPGGYVCAIRLSQYGKKVAVVERASLGGVCLNWGCIPTKSLLKNAEVISLLGKGKEYGFAFDKSSLKTDYSAAHKRSRKVSARLSRGVDFLLKKNNVDVIVGTAKFKNKNTLSVSGGEDISAQNIVIATGSRPMPLPGVDYKNPKTMTSKEALEMTDMPKSIAVIGAGSIGMEFATVWNAYGADITVIEMQDSVLPGYDSDISDTVKKAFVKVGIKIMTSTKVEKIDLNGEKATLEVSDSKGKSKITCDKVLISIGIKPNTEDLALDKAGVKTEKGYITIDNAMKTNVPGIFAIGDVTGKLALAHTASEQGLAAAAHIAGKHAQQIDYDMVPKCTYCTPEVASIGLSKAQAEKKGYKVKAGAFPFMANGKAIGMNETEGFVKIVSDAKYGEILGAHMVGPHVTELIGAFSGYIQNEMTVDEVAEIIHPHPTLSETIGEAAMDILGLSLHK